VQRGGRVFPRLPVASTFLYALSRRLTVVLHDAKGGKFDEKRWFALVRPGGSSDPGRGKP
jgi:hypothetical protein